MTDAELKRLVNQGLRNARRVYRASDTAGEQLERWLDRMIERKTRVTCAQMDSLIPRWEEYRNKVQSLEKALADVFSAACI
jgi:polyhydroxyalkanoate synthesis regulator phasin